MKRTETRPASRSRTRSRRSALMAALALGSATQADAAEWQWTITPYAWATDVGVDVALSDHDIVDQTIPFDDLLEDLELVVQVHAEGQRGEHGLMLDLFDVRLSSDDNSVTLPADIGAIVDSEVGMTILEAGGIYDPHGDRQGVSWVYGARILDQRARIDAQFEQDGTPIVTRKYDTHETLVDGLVGVRYAWQFTPRWSSQLRIDASTGGTDLTWSAGSAIGYTFGAANQYTLSGGYRYMNVRFDTDEPFDVDMTLSGFVVGFSMAL